jgi:hypothetical protein
VRKDAAFEPRFYGFLETDFEEGFPASPELYLGRIPALPLIH